VDLDRQSIERRDFPIGRRGYDPAAVDAHLRALASAVEELERTAAGRGGDSLAVSAGTQVQSIVAAAETAATEIESQAQANADAMREQAESDAEKIRADAVAQAQAQVAAVGRASATLLARVESMDGQVGALVESLRGGATRLAGDLAAVETNMGELYDAAAGRRSEGTLDPAGRKPAVEGGPAPVPSASQSPPAPSGGSDAPRASAGQSPGVSSATPLPSSSPVSLPERSARAGGPSGMAGPPSDRASVSDSSGSTENPLDQSGEGADYDARLVALNMALNGDSREETDRYIAENYEVPDRKKLLDEVFAAIEG
jgi:hypothetical protein